MIFLCLAGGCILVASTLLDAFEVVLLPRPARRRLRVNRFFFRWSWSVWAWVARRIQPGRRREDFIGVFGPLSMVSLFGAWALLLIVGFGLLHWSVQYFSGGGPLMSMPDAMVVSGDAFFTLGYGDVVPRHASARMLVIAEAGTGFGYIALTIAYLPVLYQHFSRRDYQLIELSARAGTPPTADALLQWHAAAGGLASLNQWLRDWEIWASDLTESHSAYPMLAFYRSQHEGHSWLAALAVVLDTCALAIAGSAGGGPPQAAATFAAARRALNVVAGSLEIPARAMPPRGGAGDMQAHWVDAMATLLPDWHADHASADALAALQQAYEPVLAGLSFSLMLDLPQWTAAAIDGACAPASRASVVRMLTPRQDAQD